MKTVFFVSSNQGKIDNLNYFLEEFTDKVKFEMLRLDFEEIKTDTLEGTAINKARTAYEKTNKELVVTDTGIFIEALNGFPGVNTNYALETIGNEGIIRLMKDKTNRNAVFKVCLAHINNTGETNVFCAETNIEIVNEIIDKNGFGWDCIAQADGERFSEYPKNEKRLFPYKESIKQFVESITKIEKKD
ncbi:hypothetical protein GOV05_01010 [Candidatus Woesearchaeota archaeon]|nr:hypothetical protein [Candidatus Woesearchaeota archaeon]